jgi:hypothetical protein
LRGVEVGLKVFKLFVHRLIDVRTDYS